MGFGAKKLPVGPTVHYVNKPILIFFLTLFKVLIFYKQLDFFKFFKKFFSILDPIRDLVGSDPDFVDAEVTCKQANFNISFT